MRNLSLCNWKKSDDADTRTKDHLSRAMLKSRLKPIARGISEIVVDINRHSQQNVEKAKRMVSKAIRVWMTDRFSIGLCVKIPL